MFLNICILLFFILMVYWWGAVQGVFSAMLHLAVTIAAATLALAWWEPLVVGFLIKRMPAYCWGIGLLGPFVLWLIALRVASDKLVRGNVIMPNWANWVFGGLMGFFSAVISSGLLIIGLGFLPLPTSLMGYRPLSVSTDGTLAGHVGEGLWLPVDKWTQGFFNTVSLGSMSTANPLALRQPQIAQQAALFRMRYDSDHSLAIDPASVKIDAWYQTSLPISDMPTDLAQALGDRLKEIGGKLVVVDTTWTVAAATYAEGKLTIPPTQVRLIAVNEGHKQTPGSLIAPVCAGQFDPVIQSRKFIPFLNDREFVTSTFQEVKVSFAFVLPEGKVPGGVLLRHLRYDLPGEPELQREPLLASMGRPPIQVDTTDTTGQTPPDGDTPGAPGGREGVVAGGLAASVEVNDTLPRPFSKNYTTDFSYEDDAVTSGKGELKKPEMAPPMGLRVTRVYAPSGLKIVRVRIEPDRAQSIFGKAMVSAAMTQQLWLEDSFGQKWFPAGYAWRRAGDTQEISVGPGSVKAASDLPIPKLAKGDDLYVYFAVQRGAKLVRFHFGQGTSQDLNLVVPE